MTALLQGCYNLYIANNLVTTLLLPCFCMGVIYVDSLATLHRTIFVLDFTCAKFGNLVYQAFVIYVRIFTEICYK